MAIFNSILFFYEIVTQPNQGLRIKRRSELPTATSISSPFPAPPPTPDPISGKQQRERAEEEPEALGPLPRLSSSGLTLILSQRRSRLFAGPRALKPSTRMVQRPSRQRTTPPRPPQPERPKPGRASTPGLPSRRLQSERGLAGQPLPLGPCCGLSSYLQSRLKLLQEAVRAAQAADRLRSKRPPRSARGRCGSSSRPARFKFPGGPAFRLAGSSLRCAPIGGFEKHVGEGVRGPRRREDSIAR